MITYLKNVQGYQKIEKWEPSCWVNVELPNEEEIDFISEKYGVPNDFLKDISDIDERPRTEIDGEWLLIIMRIPIRSNDPGVPYITAPLGILLSGDNIITVCFFKTEMIPDFINYTNRKSVVVNNKYDFVLKLLLSSSVWFLKNLKQINNQIKIAETELEKAIKNKELQTLLKIEKSLVFFITSIKGNDILLIKLKNLKFLKEFADPELIEDVEIEIKQALETANIYSDILSGMMDAYASVISNNLNVIMKKLTSASIILMIPTLVASIYGMNVPNYFENNPFGFWIIIVFSFLLSFSGILIFKRRNWF